MSAGIDISERAKGTSGPASALALPGVHVIAGDDARALIDDASFAHAWDELATRCPWSTVFQSSAFARTWYGAYARRFAPLLAVQVGSGGTVDGLLALAAPHDGGVPVHVGTNHAEYHAWLSDPALGDAVPQALLHAVAPHMRGGLLRFLFLAPGTPIEWLERDVGDPWRAELRWHDRGLMQVGERSGVEASLRKSANKSRLARLKRYGDVIFEQLHSRDQLETYIDQIAVQCDVRQGGTHASLPFLDDREKRGFYLGIMETKGLAHAVVLRVGQTVVASHVALRDPRRVPLGLITHAPNFGHCSPGKLLILQLARLLGEQGYAEFDLTPGGSYKDRFATHSDRVAVLELYFGVGAFQRHRLRRRAIAAVDGVASVLGMSREALLARVATAARVPKAAIAAVRHPAAAAATVARRIGFAGEFVLYEFPTSAPTPAADVRFRTNALHELLHPGAEVDAGVRAATIERLQAAVPRLEAGQVVFTVTDPTGIAHSAWVDPAARSCGTDYGHVIELPVPCAVLWDDFTAPKARGRGLHQASIATRVEWCRRTLPGRPILIGVRADNGPSRHNIEKAGFRPVCTATIRVRAGRTTRDITWTGVIEGAQLPATEK